ncbi:unnamed protein product [Rhizophagus irregularis]|nr:unnamed protein product [Rhizophagus irregularis]
MDIRAVIAIDFGTTFSGFAYSNRADPEIITNDVWPQQIGVMKTNTVLQYDSNYQNVIKWGNPALAQKQSKHARKNKDLSSSKTVELFKLHLGNIPQNEKPPLPYQLNYEKVISDYLRELGKVHIINFFLKKKKNQNNWIVLILFKYIPAEFDDRARNTMRKCLYNAGLTDCKESKKVEFTTEPEAAAIYCMRNLKGQNEMIPINASFMVVDCGGGTVDLTTRRLLRDNKLSEITERTGDFCGGSYVDREFLKFLSRGFSESKYLQMRVKEEFGKLVSAIIVPKQPIAAIVRGACDYGLDMSTIVERTLKYTYGLGTHRNWEDEDPIYRKKNFKGNDETKIAIFHHFVTRGTKVGVDEEFRTITRPAMPDQTAMSFPIYKTTELSAEFCDEPGMKLLGTLRIELPDVHLGLDLDVEFSLIFGKLELVAKAKNLQNGRTYDTSFELDFKN